MSFRCSIYGNCKVVSPVQKCTSVGQTLACSYRYIVKRSSKRWWKQVHILLKTSDMHVIIHFLYNQWRIYQFINSLMITEAFLWKEPIYSLLQNIFRVWIHCSFFRLDSGFFYYETDKRLSPTSNRMEKIAHTIDLY